MFFLICLTCVGLRSAIREAPIEAFQARVAQDVVVLLLHVEPRLSRGRDARGREDLRAEVADGETVASGVGMRREERIKEKEKNGKEKRGKETCLGLRSTNAFWSRVYAPATTGK